MPFVSTVNETLFKFSDKMAKKCQFLTMIQMIKSLSWSMSYRGRFGDPQSFRKILFCETDWWMSGHQTNPYRIKLQEDPEQAISVLGTCVGTGFEMFSDD